MDMTITSRVLGVGQQQKANPVELRRTLADHHNRMANAGRHFTEFAGAIVFDLGVSGITPEGKPVLREKIDPRTDGRSLGQRIIDQAISQVEGYKISKNAYFLPQIVAPFMLVHSGTGFVMHSLAIARIRHQLARMGEDVSTPTPARTES